jgi:hypothetical protein
MARFNLDDYELVEDRLARALKEYPDLRIVTEECASPEDRARGYFIVRSAVFLNAAEQADGLPKATGWAFEIEGSAGASQTAALENAETSSLGRCLKQAFGGKGVTRSEMGKVARFEDAASKRDWLAEAQNLNDKDQLRLLWGEASKAGASTEILEQVKAYAESINVDGEREGTVTSISRGPKSKR